MGSRVAVIDANVPVREALSVALANQPRLQLVGAVRDAYEFLDLCRWAETDTVVLSTSSRGLGILRSIRLLRALFPSVGIAVLGPRADPVASVRCSEMGADSYLDGRSSMEKLVSEIAALTRESPSDRRRPLDPGVRRDDPLVVLTRRERQILECIVHGYSIPEIAREFDLGQKTVRDHWTRVRGKLGLSTPADAIAFWANLHRSDSVLDDETDSAFESGDPDRSSTSRSR